MNASSVRVNYNMGGRLRSDPNPEVTEAGRRKGEGLGRWARGGGLTHQWRFMHCPTVDTGALGQGLCLRGRIQFPVLFYTVATPFSLGSAVGKFGVYILRLTGVLRLLSDLHSFGHQAARTKANIYLEGKYTDASRSLQGGKLGKGTFSLTMDSITRFT